VNWLLVVAGGMAGAVLRYVVDRLVTARTASGFPWGTLTANATGCLLLGLVAGAALAGAATERTLLLLGTGTLGALTTYSTFSYETLRLAEDDSRALAVANVGLSVLAGLGALSVGTATAQALWP
jgi:fluoride exporter